METDILYLNPPDQNPLQTFTQILCFPSVDNGFNNEKNISCLCKLHLNSHKKTGKEILELRVPIKKMFFCLVRSMGQKKNSESQEESNLRHSDSTCLVRSMGQKKNSESQEESNLRHSDSTL